MRKSNAEILESVLARIMTSTGITDTTPGSIARLFAEVIIEEFGPIYDEINVASSMAYVSSANGPYLDLVGELVNAVRKLDENDEDFRARIVNQVSVQQNANIIALRLKALQVDGVADVQFKRFTRGTGSFTCYVTPQVYPVSNDLLMRVEEELSNVAAYGMEMMVKISEYKPVDMTINLIFQSKTTPLERDYIRTRVTTNVTNYIKQLNRGEAIIINEITQRVMETSDLILDMEYKELLISDKQFFIKNIEPSIEEQYYMRKITVA